MTKHKHAELIKAWADGAQIEYKNFSGDWEEVSDPVWMKDTEYRIKPIPHPHQACIDAWERGEDVQFKLPTSDEWTALLHTGTPSWVPCWEYRIKPPTLKYRRWVKKYYSGEYNVCVLCQGDYSAEYVESYPIFVKWIDTEWQEVEV